MGVKITIDKKSFYNIEKFALSYYDKNQWIDVDLLNGT